MLDFTVSSRSAELQSVMLFQKEMGAKEGGEGRMGGMSKKGKHFCLRPSLSSPTSGGELKQDIGYIPGPWIDSLLQLPF